MRDPETTEHNGGLGTVASLPLELMANYGERASACQRRADEASEPTTRNYWLGLANLWTRLGGIDGATGSALSLIAPISHAQ